MSEKRRPGLGRLIGRERAAPVDDVADPESAETLERALRQQLDAITREKERMLAEANALRESYAGERVRARRLQERLARATKKILAIEDRMARRRRQAAARSELDRLKKYPEFQAGTAVVNALDSWQGLLALPGELLKVRSALRKRRSAAPGPVASRPVVLPRPGDPLKRPSDFKVALIADEFTFNSFKDEFRALPVEPTGWREVFEEHRPDVFFCEAAWSGVDSVRRPWKGRIYASDRFRQENRTELLAILEYCRAAGIPTVFWNKEDPIHYGDRIHNFPKTAREFDFVFTTAAESVAAYHRDHGISNVFPLPFATNPRVFNPVESAARTSNVVFAGAWYSNHARRSRDMASILDTLMGQGFVLEIFDRHYGGDDPLHQWPARFAPFLKPALPHDRMPGVYKSSRFGLNFNTVVNSPTMFARRVFELMSSNTLVVSNHALGMTEMFGDLVVRADIEPKRLKSLTDSEIDGMREAALDRVLRHHTYRHRWLEILAAVGLPFREDDEGFTVVCRIGSREDALRAIGYYQEHGARLPGSRLLLLVRSDVSELDVAALYQEFNRFGVTVTAERHVRRYALAGRYRPVETAYFALVDPDRTPPPAEWVGRAALHLRYMTDHAVVPASGSDRYRLSPADPGVGMLLGHASLASEWFLPERLPAEVYRV